MAKNPGAKNSSGKYLDPAAAIKAGLMQKKTGEFMSPGKAIAKVAAKAAGKAAKKKVVKKATAKATAKARGFAKDKASRKEMKQQDIFYNKVGKADLKEGYRSGAARANTSNSQSPSLKKVPIKKPKK